MCVQLMDKGQRTLSQSSFIETRTQIQSQTSCEKSEVTMMRKNSLRKHEEEPDSKEKPILFWVKRDSDWMTWVHFQPNGLIASQTLEFISTQLVFLLKCTTSRRVPNTGKHRICSNSFLIDLICSTLLYHTYCIYTMLFLIYLNYNKSFPVKLLLGIHRIQLHLRQYLFDYKVKCKALH